MKKQSIEGNIIDIHRRIIYKGVVEIREGRIAHIHPCNTESEQFILPGFIDAHVHIESSMLTPAEFGRMVIAHGTVAVVSDPHEIANVMGESGIRFMQEDACLSPIKTFFTIPSCVPATPFDRSGGEITANDVETMAESGMFVALSEMMNVPGVLAESKVVLAKIKAAHKHKLPIDGHAPMLSGDDLKAYIAHGISTDHECSSLEEAKEKLSLGMKIMIREGSAAKNFDTLKSLIPIHYDNLMLCTDDAHADEIVSNGHINRLVRRSIEEGFNLFDLLQMACINPVEHYHLNVGLLKEGDPADFIVVDNLACFNTKEVYIKGVKQYSSPTDHPNQNNVSTLPRIINHFHHSPINSLSLRKEVMREINIIELVENELITLLSQYNPSILTTNLQSDPANDITKIVYINRYDNAPPQVAFCKGFGMKQGAIASSVAHDSHNIVAAGCSDDELTEAINAVINCKGGLAVCVNQETEILPLPIGGIMSQETTHEVTKKLHLLDRKVQHTGCRLHAPFMTLSFLSLLVIPHVRIGEKGLHQSPSSVSPRGE